MKRLLVSALASGFVLLVLAFSGCGETPPLTRCLRGTRNCGAIRVRAGYQAGYIGCEGYTPRQVAREFEGASEEPRAAAEGFAGSSSLTNGEARTKAATTGSWEDRRESADRRPQVRRVRADPSRPVIARSAFARS